LKLKGLTNVFLRIERFESWGALNLNHNPVDHHKCGRYAEKGIAVRIQEFETRHPGWQRLRWSIVNSRNGLIEELDLMGPERSVM